MRSEGTGTRPPYRPTSTLREATALTLRSAIFQSLMVLSFVESSMRAEPDRLHHAIWLIFSSISRDLR